MDELNNTQQQPREFKQQQAAYCTQHVLILLFAYCAAGALAAHRKMQLAGTAGSARGSILVTVGGRKKLQTYRPDFLDNIMSNNMIGAQDAIQQAAAGKSTAKEATASAGDLIRAEVSTPGGGRRLQTYRPDFLDNVISNNMIGAQDAVQQAAAGKSKAKEATASAGDLIRAEVSIGGRRKLQTYRPDFLDNIMSNNMIGAQDAVQQAAAGKSTVKEATASAGDLIRAEVSTPGGGRRLQTYRPDFLDNVMSNNMIGAQDAVQQAAAGKSKAKEATASAGDLIRAEVSIGGRRKLQTYRPDFLDNIMSNNMIGAQDAIQQAAAGKSTAKEATASAGDLIRAEVSTPGGGRKLQTYRPDFLDNIMSNNMIDAQDAIQQAAAGKSTAKEATASAGDLIRAEVSIGGRRKLQTYRPDFLDNIMSNNMVDAQDAIQQAAAGKFTAKEATASAGDLIRAEVSIGGRRKLQQLRGQTSRRLLL